MHLLSNILPGNCVLAHETGSCTSFVESVTSYAKSQIVLLSVQEQYYWDSELQRCYVSREHYKLKRVPKQPSHIFELCRKPLPTRFQLTAFHSTAPLNDWQKFAENIETHGAPTKDNIHRITTDKYWYTGVVVSIETVEQGMMLISYRDGAQLQVRPTDGFEFRFGIRSPFRPIEDVFVLTFDDTK